MRRALATLALLAVLPLWADSRFRLTEVARSDIPRGKAQCEIRLQVDGEVELTLRRYLLLSHTLSGADARDDGSDCTAPLPDRAIRGFQFQKVEGPGEARLMAEPSAANDYAVVVRIRNSGGFASYHLRLVWDSEVAAPPPTLHSGPTKAELPKSDFPKAADHPPSPEGFVWNNVLTCHGRGGGEVLLDDYAQRLGDVAAYVDLGANLIVTFVPDRPRRAPGKPRPVIFFGSLRTRDGGKWTADVSTEDHSLRGAMTLTLDAQQNILSVALDATDGRDRLHLAWSHR